MDKVKVGVIGCGNMAQQAHIPSIKANPDAELTAICDFRRKVTADLCRRWDIPFATDSIAELLKQDLDAVYILTPLPAHLANIKAALAAGKAVFTEKPVAMSIEEVDRMINTAKEMGVLFTVHQNRRWDKDFRIVKEIIESGELGNVYAIHSRLHGTRGAMFGWRAEPEHGGGMIYDWGVHFVDQLLWMLGYDSIKSVFCKTVKVKTPEVEDYFYLVMDLKNGCHIQMEVGTWVLKQLPRWMVLGDKGTLYINDFTRNGGVISVDETVEPEEIVVMTTSGPTRTFAPRGAKEILEHELPDSPAELTEYYANLRDAVDGKAELIVQPWQVRRVFEVLEAMFKSAATGDQIKF